MIKYNLFDDIPEVIEREITEVLAQSSSVRIEKIVSQGQSSPENFWYDQEENEWVILLRGSAILEFENGEFIQLDEGDYINIPAHKKHRVEWTVIYEQTIWLAVFYK
jgi:cupin 2 domain-containing protein